MTKQKESRSAFPVGAVQPLYESDQRINPLLPPAIFGLRKDEECPQSTISQLARQLSEQISNRLYELLEERVVLVSDVDDQVQKANQNNNY